MTLIRGRFLAALTLLSLLAGSALAAVEWSQIDVVQPEALVGRYMFQGDWKDATPTLYKDGVESAYVIVKVKADFFFRPKAGGKDKPVKLSGVKNGGKVIYASNVPPGLEPKLAAAAPATMAPKQDWRSLDVRTPDGNGTQTLYYDANAAKSGTVPLLVAKDPKAAAAGTVELKDGHVLARDAKGKTLTVSGMGGPITAADPKAGTRTAGASLDESGTGAAGRAPAAVPEIERAGSVEDPAAAAKDPFAVIQRRLAGHEGDIAERIYDFIRTGGAEKKRFYVEGALTAAHQAQVLDWVKKNPGPSAVLYYGLGAGEKVPAWVNADPTLKGLFVERSSEKLAGFEAKLGACLDRWASGPGRPDYCLKDEDKKAGAAAADLAGKRIPLAGGEAAGGAWMLAFLTDAQYEAGKILSTRPEDLALAMEKIGAAPEGGDVPPVGLTGAGTAGKVKPGVDASGAFNVQHLFGAWGDYNVIHFPTKDGAKDGRTVAVVLRQRKPTDNPPNCGDVEVGVYDISDPSRIYGRRFTLAYNNDAPFVLDDANPGGFQYKLKYVPSGNETKIQLERADGVKGVYGNATAAKEGLTLSGLYRDRAKKVKSADMQTEVGGKTYYVSGESSNFGSLLFWEKETIDRMAAGDARSLNPTMMANVSRRGGNGLPVNLKDQVSLGKVNEKWYDLVWNPGLNIWEPKEGKEPKPEPKPSTSTATAPGSAPAGAPTIRVGEDGWPEIEAGNTFRLYAQLNDGLDPALRKDSVRFLENTASDSPLTRIFINAKCADPAETMGSVNGLPFYDGLIRRVKSGDRYGEEIVGGHVLRVSGAYEDGVKTGYTELSGITDCKEVTKGSFYSSRDLGTIGVRKAGQFEVKLRDWAAHKAVLVDALRDRTVLGSKAAEVSKIVARVEKRLKGRSATVSGNSKMVSLDFAGEESCNVYPDDKCEDGAIGATPDGTRPQNSVSFDPDGSGFANGDEAFPQTVVAKDVEGEAALVSSSEGAALYQHGKDKEIKFFVLYKIRAKDGLRRISSPLFVSKDPEFMAKKPVLGGIIEFKNPKGELLPLDGSGLRPHAAALPKYRETYAARSGWGFFDAGEENQKYKSLHGCFILWGGAKCEAK